MWAIMQTGYQEPLEDKGPARIMENLLGLSTYSVCNGHWIRLRQR
jgi:hypothetical protein